MAKLTEEQKYFIVTELACYRTPSEVAELVKERFGVEVSRAQVHQYDPHGYGGSELAKKWKDLHKATREAFLKDVAAVPSANKAYRVRELHDAAMRAKQRNNLPLMAQLLEQIAKETGDVFTNRVNHNHRGAIGTYLTDEQIDRELMALLGGDSAAGGA